MRKRLAVTILAALAAPQAALAQSAPNWPTHYNPSAAEWQHEFSLKADVPNGTLSTPKVVPPLTLGAVQELTGIGAPNGIVVAPPGSVYHRQDAGPGAALYVKESGTGNTGWTAYAGLTSSGTVPQAQIPFGAVSGTVADGGATAAAATAAANAQATASAALPAAVLGAASGAAQLDAASTLNANMHGPGQPGSINRTAAAHDADRVNILDYGAKCDGRLVTVPNRSTVWHGVDGITPNPNAPQLANWVPQPLTYYSGSDDAGAISAALAVALAQNKPLYIPGSFPGSVSGRTGYCLMRSGNPLGQTGSSGAAAITGPLTVEGDGMDVSRLVQFADNPQGSVSSVANGGTGYAVGDIVGVIQGSATAPVLKLEVVAVGANGAATDVISVGDPASQMTAAKGVATTTTCGLGGAAYAACSVANGGANGLTVNVVVGGVGITTPIQSTAAARIASVQFRDFSIIATGQQNPGQALACGDPYSIWSVSSVQVARIGIDYSRCLSFTGRQLQSVSITNSRIRYSARDMINVSSPWTIISGNLLEHGGDDSIAATDQPSESGALPFREGVAIANNFITDAGGIDVLGSVGVTVTGNTMVRMKLEGIRVGPNFAGGAEGATPARSVVVTGNTVTDIFNVAGDPIFGGQGSQCYMLGSMDPSAGENAGGLAGPGTPGFPTAAGGFTSPYEVNIGGTMYWPMFTNGVYPSSTSTAPAAGGLGTVIANNTCIRTMPIDASEWFSSLGFGDTYGANGWLDFQLDPAQAYTTQCIDDRYGTLSAARVEGNICSGIATAFSVDPPNPFPGLGAHLYDAIVKGNIFRDFNVGLSMSGAPAGQRIAFEGNTWDGDPYFQSPNRTTAGLQSGAESFTGAITGNLLTVTGAISGGAILPGQWVEGSGVPAGTVIQAYLTQCPAGQTCAALGSGGDGTYQVSEPAGVTAILAETMQAGRPIFTGGWTQAAPNLPLMFNGVAAQGIEFRGDRFRNLPYIGALGAGDRQVDNIIYGSTNSAKALAGVGGGNFFGIPYPTIADGWEQIIEDSDPRDATYGQVTAPTTAQP